MGDEPEQDVSPNTAEGTKHVERLSWTRRHYVVLSVIAALIVFSVAIYFLSGLLGDVETYGYLGVFLISAMASAVIIIPIPAIAIVFGMGAVLNPWLVGLMAGLGEPIGELVAYMAGYSGRIAMENRGFYVRLSKWMERRGSLVLFLFSAIPNWFFDIVGVAAGALRYPLWKYILVVFLGKTVKGWLVAFAGYWTLRLLLQHFVG